MRRSLAGTARSTVATGVVPTESVAPVITISRILNRAGEFMVTITEDIEREVLKLQKTHTYKQIIRLTGLSMQSVRRIVRRGRVRTPQNLDAEIERLRALLKKCLNEDGGVILDDLVNEIEIELKK